MNLENILLYVSVAFAVSEGLAMIPAVKANSIFQLIFSLLKALVPKKDKLELPK